MTFEAQFIPSYPCWLVATDEAGRGPLAGPVVAAAAAVKLQSPSELVALIDALRSCGVTDSKKLSALRREELRNLPWAGIKLEWCELSAQEIDQLNILAASLKAMRLAAEAAVSHDKNLPVVWLIDGNRKPKDAKADWQVQTVVAGDSHSALIGLASIVAKVERDRIMQGFHLEYPQYGFNQHAGYPTAQHRAAIITHGASQIHRKTFKGVREYLPR